jgi:hypothetical protein
LPTLNSRTLDLLQGGLDKDAVADLLGLTPEEVQTVVQDLENLPTPPSEVPNVVVDLTVVSAEVQQDTTGLPSDIYVVITPHALGTVAVAIGPTDGVANAIISDGATLAFTEKFRLPANWFFEVTVGGSAAIASAIQVTS